MLLTLEPMAHLPFDFSIDFEKRQQEEAARIARQQEEAGTMLNTGQSSSTQPSPSQVRVVCVCVCVCVHATTVTVMRMYMCIYRHLSAVWLSRHMQLQVKG